MESALGVCALQDFLGLKCSQAQQQLLLQVVQQVQVVPPTSSSLEAC
jgi:hypothetical protein